MRQDDHVQTGTVDMQSGMTSKNVQYKSITEDRDETSELTAETHGYKAVQYKLYPWRWFMLVTLCFLNVSNGMVRLGEVGMPS